MDERITQAVEARLKDSGKSCVECDTFKDVRHYNANLNAIDGLSSYCRECEESD